MGKLYNLLNAAKKAEREPGVVSIKRFPVIEKKLQLTSADDANNLRSNLFAKFFFCRFSKYSQVHMQTR